MINMRPYITEKTVNLAKIGKFTLIVDGTATRTNIESAVSEVFKVKPLNVNIICKKSAKRKRARGVATNRGFKKAIVMLASGQKIPGFEIAQDSNAAKEAKKETKKEKNESKVKK